MQHFWLLPRFVCLEIKFHGPLLFSVCVPTNVISSLQRFLSPKCDHTTSLFDAKVTAAFETDCSGKACVDMQACVQSKQSYVHKQCRNLDLAINNEQESHFFAITSIRYIIKCAYYWRDDKILMENQKMLKLIIV